MVLTILTYYVDVFVVRKANAEVRDLVLSLFRSVEYFRRIRERVPRTIARRGICVADRTDNRLSSSKKLLAMTSYARRVFGIIGYILERSVTLAYFVPVGGWKLVA